MVQSWGCVGGPKDSKNRCIWSAIWPQPRQPVACMKSASASRLFSKVIRFGAPASRSPLVVASYNIHGCIGTDRKHDTTRVARVIREINADVLGLQELHAHGVGGDPSDETQLLAAVSEFEVVTGTT